MNARAREPDPRAQERTMARALGLAVAIALCCIAGSARAESPGSLLAISAAKYQILNATTDETIGHDRYTVTRVAGGYVVRGRAVYSNGQYDREVDRLRNGAPGEPVRLSAYQHEYYNADGSHELAIVADLISGEASCTDWRASPPTTYTATLTIPPDTYAGASVALPLEQFLRQGATGAASFHVLYCAPRPKVYAVTASTVTRAESWPYWNGDSVEIEVKPDFGWLNLVASPFVPRTEFFFTSGKDVSLVGAELNRYYKGPRIRLVRELPGASRS